MSPQLISRSPDLARLRSEGYDIVAHEGYLELKDVPYLNKSGVVLRGTLVAVIDSMSGDRLGPPNDHTVYFAGDWPCDDKGKPLSTINSCGPGQTFAPDLVTNHKFSAKPKSGRYRDYHHKLTTYVSLIESPATIVEPKATAMTCATQVPDDPESPFCYDESASTRAGISAITAKLAGQRIGIVGLGGTGSYILDQVAKTPVAEIHLFDGDDFLNHNAFRAPGAASLEELRGRPTKIEYWCKHYGRMHRGIRPHEYRVTTENAAELQDLDFVFVAVDSGPSRKLVVEKLLERSKPFIDVGMGLGIVQDSLRGVVRVTACCDPDSTQRAAESIPLGGGGTENEYSRNVQIAELNMLNAALAIICWKKWSGFYLNQGREYHSLYTLGTNRMDNETILCETPSEPDSPSASLAS